MDDDTAQNQNPVNPSPSGGKFGKGGLAGAGESLSTVSGFEATLEPETYQAPETISSLETAEKPQPIESKPQEPVKEPLSQDEVKPAVKVKVVDKRTGKIRTHRVDPKTSDPITKEADILEQEFLEGVEQVHSII